MSFLNQILHRLISHAAASTSSCHLSREIQRACKSGSRAAFFPRKSRPQQLNNQIGRPSRSSRPGLAQLSRVYPGNPWHQQISRSRGYALMRGFQTSRETAAPALLVPLYVLYSLGKVWIFKPLGVLFKSLTFGNSVKAYRVVMGIRNTWEYRLVRRIVVTTAVVATLGAAAILVGCDFDDARAAAVIGSVPRTLGSAGWCLQTAWTYKWALMSHSDPESWEYQSALKEAHQQCAARLVQLCGENGGIYVKAAQFVASMQTTPPEYRRELEKLQDQAQPQAFEDAKRVLESELGQPFEDVFTDFELDAKAAASLAQVHRAKLKDGRSVAVKVQYLGLESAVSADLSTLTFLGAIAALIFPNSFEFGWVVRRLGANLAKELDFRIEAKNAMRLSQYMAGNPCIAVPQQIPEFSSQRVLTMEWVEGVKLNDRKGMVDKGIRPREAAIQLLKGFGQMIFIHGFVHADPHAGNMLVRQRPGKQSWRWLLFGLGWRQPQIVLLDHGLYVDLPEALRQNYCALWCSFLVNDMATATVVGQSIAGERGGKLLPKLLKPGELTSQEQKENFRKEAGIDGLGDIGRLIEGLPEEFLQLLRIVGVVRPTALNLGASNTDRLRINASCANKGLWTSKEAIPATLNAIENRVYMAVTLDTLRFIYCISCGLQELFDAVMFFPTKMAHAMYEARYS